MERFLPNGAGADTIGAVNREMPERSVAPPGVSGDERKRGL